MMGCAVHWPVGSIRTDDHATMEVMTCTSFGAFSRTVALPMTAPNDGHHQWRIGQRHSQDFVAGVRLQSPRAPVAGSL